MLYKNKEDIEYKCDVNIFPDNKIQFIFTADCGKFGTDEILFFEDYSVRELLTILQKQDDE